MATGQREESASGLLHYEYIKNHYKSIALDLIRLKELDADLKAIQQVELVGTSKTTDGVNVDDTQPMFFLNNF